MPLNDRDAADLERRLLSEHGELIGGTALARGLGYRTARAFQVAVQRERMPIETFTLTGRRGRFARTFELARWLASRGAAEPAASEPATNAEAEPAGPQGGDAMR
ncbi:hypothetical protein [Aerolutibacter ruishenii]|nr:hypothetical protein [Lysobacter ruishenii]